MKKKHPMQPIYLDSNGTARFRENKIVSFLLEAGPFDLNQLALMPFDVKDREQFLQLIGVTVGSFGDYDCVKRKTYQRADRIVEKLLARE